MDTLSKSERNALAKMQKSRCGRNPRVHYARGEWFLPDGKRIGGGAISNLIEKGALVPCNDGLFKGHDQTWIVDLANMAART